MRCASCGHDNVDDAQFCDQCSADFAPVCPVCKAENQVGARFCRKCRATLAPEPDEQAAPAKASPREPPSVHPVAFGGGRYEVKRFLGEGGRKRVFLARDTRLDRKVAIALIKTDGLDEAGLSRVNREAQAMARLGDHPHIVTIHDIGEENGQPYIVSQYMAGGELTDRLNEAENRRLSLNEALRISNEVRQALEHAHGRGIIHRDIKPANIWLTEDGIAKLGDFGLAVALDRSRLTLEGTLVGTVAYMPPEQALGRQPDARSDLYSLGCVLYEMLTGRPPFLGDDNVAIISQHINTAPVAPSWHNPEIPKALESLIMRCLAKNPEERPESAAAIPDALIAIAETASRLAAERVSEEAAANPLDRLAGGVFVGREKEMDELRAGLEDALSGRGRLLMLVGEPGIGKTRMSEELATYASLRNARVLWGKCYEGEGAPAYWPWVQLVRSYVFDRDPKELMSEMGPGAADIAEVVSEVRERLPGLQAPPQLEPEQARFRLFDSITTFLKNASQRQPHVLVLDDLHWADKPSLLLLQFMARELRGSRLLVLGTYRDVELRRAHPLSQTLAELTREGLSQRILLRGLTERDVARFIEMTAGIQPPEALVEAVYRETEGNPFFVNEIVRLLVTDGRLERPETVTSWSVTIPQGVREVVGRRLDHLSDECNRVLTVGSVIGREFDLSVLERVILRQTQDERPIGDRLLEALEEAVAARLIADVPRAVARYSFSHALIRETLYEELSTARRVRLHRHIGEVIEELESLNMEAHLPQLAHHFCEAAQGGDIDKAIDYASRAGERATELLAYEEAVGHYERGLQVSEMRDQAEDSLQSDLLIATGNAHLRAGDTSKAREVFRRAVDLARRGGHVQQLANAAVGFGAVVDASAIDEELIRLLEEALDVLPAESSAVRAKVMSRLAGALVIGGSRERRETLSREAVEMANLVGDSATLAYVLIGRHFAMWGPENVEERLSTAREIVRAAEEAGDEARAISGHQFCAIDLLEIGDISQVEAEIETIGYLAENLRQPLYLWSSTTSRATIALLYGQFDEAERYAQQSLVIGRRIQPETVAQQFGVQMLGLRREQGRLQEVEDPLKAFTEAYPAVPAWRAALAYVYSELGRQEEARREFERLASDDFEGLPRDLVWLPAIAVLAESCAFLGDHRRAAILYDLLLPYSGRNITAGLILCQGAASRELGLLAATMSRWEQAEAHFRDAIEANARMEARPWLAHTQHEYAQMLLRRDEPGDREKALQLLAVALDTAQELGMKALIERALALKLEAQGVRSTNIDTSIDAVASAVYVDKPDLKRQAAPDGTVTILFSDIQDSTAKTEQLGDTKWMEVLREHNAVVREQLKAHGGFEVKSEGDGFMLAFQSARKALRCAIETQRAFAKRNESAEEPVLVRMGLHTGEVIKEGDDFFGKHVNLAARIAGQASGGEIMVSSLLKELTASSGDIAFGDGREVTLKGLSGEHVIYGVNWA